MLLIKPVAQLVTAKSECVEDKVASESSSVLAPPEKDHTAESADNNSNAREIGKRGSHKRKGNKSNAASSVTTENAPSAV